MKTLKLKSKLAREVVSEGNDDYELVSDEIIDEWRWGNLYESIIKDEDGNLWGSTYRVQTGDNYHHEFEDLDEVEFYPVKAVEVKKIVYKRIKD
jgi:hypothetical protein